MKIYKKIFIILVLLASSLIPSLHISAQTYYYTPHSIATEDGFLATKINPSALGFGNNIGAGFSTNLNNNESGSIKEMNINGFSFSAGIPNLGYYLEREENSFFHNIGAGFAIAPNIYLGLGLQWQDGYFRTPGYILSGLIRPADFISLGVKGNYSRSSVPVYLIGAGLKPLYFSPFLGERITAAVDFSIKGKKVLKPMLSIHTEMVDGLTIMGGWDMEDRSVGLEMGFAFPFLKIGTSFVYDNSSKIKTAEGFTFISGKEFRSVAKRKNHRLIKYQFGERVIETQNAVNFSYFVFKQPQKDIIQVIKELKRIENDRSVGGVVFINQNFNTSFANYMEISQLLQRLKKSGKKIIFYYQEASNLNYALSASVADKIYLQPQGYISLVGLAMASPYMKDFLSLLGIEVLNIRSHPYKSAYNMYSESGMTKEESEQLNLVADSLYSSMCRMIEIGRKDKLKRPVQEIINDGPYLVPERALEEGLIDGVIYQDELFNEIKKLYPHMKITNYLFTGKVRYDWSKEPSSRIAIIHAVGPIHTGEGRDGSTIGSKTLIRAIQKAREDSTVGGIIIRVSSGGGSAVASEAIAREIKLTVNGKNPKPVLISMGGVAASGGYYISANATKIVAEPVTITGSIGAVAVFPNISVLSRKLGINWETIKRGKHSDMGAIYRELTDEEKRIIVDFLDSIYNQFVVVVSEGRKIDIKEVKSIAQGKIWTGEQAKEKGLVDELGGLSTTIDLLKDILGLKEEPEIIEVSGQKPMRDFLMSGGVIKGVVEKNLPEELNELFEVYKVYLLLEDEVILLIDPNYFLNYN